MALILVSLALFGGLVGSWLILPGGEPVAREGGAPQAVPGPARHAA